MSAQTLMPSRELVRRRVQAVYLGLGVYAGRLPTVDFGVLMEECEKQ
jgi:hypothetical protein